MGIVAAHLIMLCYVRLLFVPYQRLWLYNGAPLVAFFTTRWGYGGRILDLIPRLPHRGSTFNSIEKKVD